MNFQDLEAIEDYQFYLDLASNKAKKTADKIRGKKLRMEPMHKSKLIETTRIDSVRNVLIDRLKQILSSYPNIDELPEFYISLVRCTLDYAKLKKSLGAMKWAVKKINSLYKDHLERIRRTKDLKKINVYRRQFYGRVSSVLKQIKKELAYLEHSRRVMKNFPTIKTKLKTIAIAGFPNVGKTTLMYKLTGSKPEIKSYAFTTKGVNVSYLNTKGEKLQLLDTPGTLNRFAKMNNIERIAWLAMQLLAEKIIYVFDLTEPYPIEAQIKLYKKVKEMKKPVIAYVSKTDIINKDYIEEFAEEHKKIKPVISPNSLRLLLLKAKE